MTSGRLMPAAATSISTSPAPGSGVGRVVCLSTSGPPGAVISIAIMVAGRAVMASFLRAVSHDCTSSRIAPHWQLPERRGERHGRGGSAPAAEAPGQEGSDPAGHRRAGDLHHRARDRDRAGAGRDFRQAQAARRRRCAVQALMEIGEIPLTAVGTGGAAALFDAHPDRAAALIETALHSYPFLPIAAAIAGRLSRRWLERQETPYLDEIRHIAARLGRPGVYFLNIVYEWACSTSGAPDPGGPGARLIRVLDWGLTGLGRHVVIARQDSACGTFYNATWPGFAGVLTAMAPARFAAAINQAPRLPIFGPRWIDEVARRLRMLRNVGAIPAAHLLRRVFEEAPDYDAAQAMLADQRHLLAMPALFILSGTTREQACVT